MKFFSFLKPLSKGARWVGRGFLLFWRAGKFSFFPSEKNLLVSFWYDFIQYKKLIPGATVLTFLDQRVVEYKSDLKEGRLSRYRRRLTGELLDALYNPRLRTDIVAFLESPNPEENYLPLWDDIKSAWRLEEEKQTKLLSMDGPQEHNLADGSSKTLADQETVKEEENNHSPRLDARTYVIAADIYFELAGKQAEFKKLQTEDLKKFVQEKFGLTHVPGTFRNLRKYSYMKVLNNGNDAERGQLKPQFRQIIDNPDIFGEALVKKARKLLDDYFI
jgi:hypothetical protein